MFFLYEWDVICKHSTLARPRRFASYNELSASLRASSHVMESSSTVNTPAENVTEKLFVFMEVFNL